VYLAATPPQKLSTQYLCYTNSRVKAARDWLFRRPCGGPARRGNVTGQCTEKPLGSRSQRCKQPLPAMSLIGLNRFERGATTHYRTVLHSHVSAAEPACWTPCSAPSRVPCSACRRVPVCLRPRACVRLFAIAVAEPVRSTNPATRGDDGPAVGVQPTPHAK
jgi:hypothetical protein